MKHKKHLVKMDERQVAIQGKANGIVLVFLMLCLMAAAIYRSVTKGETGWELVALIACFPVMMLARRLYGDAETPRDYRNRPLPTGSTKKERLNRAQSYAIDGLTFAVPMALINVGLQVISPQDQDFLRFLKGVFPALDRVPLLLVTTLITFTIFYAVAFLAQYLVTELVLVKQYNRLLEKLDGDAEESDLAAPQRRKP